MRLQRKGLAAHWRYKHDDTSDAARSASDNLNTWLTQIREMLESGEEDALDFIDEFKLNLHSEEIFVFTPNGDLFSLPKGATTLDFAFRVHTQIGSRCIGAKVNHKLVPLSHAAEQRRSSGDHHVAQAEAQGGLAQVCDHGQRPIQNSACLARGRARHRQRRQRETAQVDAPQGAGILVDQHRLASSNDCATTVRMRLLMRIATGELDLDRLGGFTVVKGKFAVDARQERRQLPRSPSDSKKSPTRPRKATCF